MSNHESRLRLIDPAGLVPLGPWAMGIGAGQGIRLSPSRTPDLYTSPFLDHSGRTASGHLLEHRPFTLKNLSR